MIHTKLRHHWRKCSGYQTVKNGKKSCKSCQQWVDVKKFKRNKHLSSKYASICRDCSTSARLQGLRKLKQEFVDAYGGKCTCCGIKEIEFLTLEHIFNDGAKERKQLREDGIVGKKKAVGSVIYKLLKKRGWPKDRYTVLCWNCNCARKWGRPCPHEKIKYQSYINKVEFRARIVARCKV